MTNYCRSWILLSICITYLILGQSTAYTQTITADKLDTKPVIDGKLDDNAWQQITPIGKFLIAELKTTVPDQTKVYIGFDDAALYVGFQCFQDKTTMIANQTRRDGSFKFEDHVAVYLDTYHDKQRTYRFAVNPLGTQLDEKQGNPRLGWCLVSCGKRNRC